MRAWIVEALQLLAADAEAQVRETYGAVPDEVAFAGDDYFPWAGRVYEGGRFSAEEKDAVDRAYATLDTLTFPDEPHLVVLDGPAWHAARAVARESLAVLGIEPRQPLHLTEWPGLSQFE